MKLAQGAISAAKSARLIVAVSGGVDSVVLLHKLVRQRPGWLLVAHVDHGIRPDSAQDAEFVAHLARQYGLPFRCHQLQLGPVASEQAARTARYAWLRQLASQYQAVIVTGHHADDLVESIAINLVRGTGWRGLAVFGAADIQRPLVAYRKQELYTYARQYHLEWREDSTNHTAQYLRSRLRQPLQALSPKQHQQLFSLWQKQRRLAQHIDAEAQALITWRRYFYCQAPAVPACAVLRATLATREVSLTRPQLERALLAIKVARPGTRHSLGSSRFLVFTRRQFSVLESKK